MTLSFLETDPNILISDLKQTFEAASGRKLYPAQVENLLLHVLAYADSLKRAEIQHCAEQNLVAYAIEEHLDALGQNKGCPRLQPVAAECKLRFTLDQPTAQGRTFPASTRITTDDGRFIFETTDPAYVITGQTLSTEVKAQSTTTGVKANKLPPGILTTLDPEIEGVTATNTTATDRGGDLETDEAYRVRLMLAAARYGSGGTKNAYRYWALTASTMVADALPVQGAEPGDINIYILSTDGTPTPALLAQVQEVCNSNEVALINDYITAIPAIRKPYSIRAEITIYDTHDPDIITDKITKLAHEYALNHRKKLGQDVTPTQVEFAFKTLSEGIYNINLIEPAQILEVGNAEWADATEITITYVGAVRG